MDPHLISVDELRMAGALDVPAAWRKSLGGGEERKQFSLFGEEEALNDESTSSADDFAVEAELA